MSRKELVPVKVWGRRDKMRAVLCRCGIRHTIGPDVQKVYCSCPTTLLVDRRN